MKRDGGTAAQGIGDPYVPHSGNRGFTVSHYELDLDYRVSTNALSGTATLTATVLDRPLEGFTLDLVGLKAGKVTVNGKHCAHGQHRGKLVVSPSTALPAGSTFTVTVQYSGSPKPTKGWWGDIGWEELTDGVLVASQPNGAGTWFPCNDHPSDKASYGIAVTAPSAYTVVAPGSLAAKQVKASRTRWTYRQHEPMATYLVTLQLGLYEAFDLEGGTVPQRAYIPRSLRTAFDSDFGDQNAMIALFEELFGPYPFERYSVVVTDDELEIPLEAQGMSIFGRNHVTGQGLDERLIAHELAHQWFGNSLTVNSWRHIWLHEGFACYAEWLWSEGGGGPTADTLARQHHARLAALPRDIIVGDPGPDAMFDDRVYKRGALTLHALRLAMGESAFFDCLRAWTAENRFGSIDTDGFVATAVRFGGESVAPLLERWLFRAQLPAIAPA